MRIACAFVSAPALASAVRERPSLVDPEAVQAALRDAALSVSPSVEVSSPHQGGRSRGVYADLTSVIGFHGGERQAALALRAAIGRAGLAVSVGVAGTRLAAYLAARRGGVERLPEGGERLFLAPWPLAEAPLSAELLETLQRWGLRTLGELAALPREGVGARLGNEGVRLHRLACGEEVDPWQPIGAVEELTERVELEWGVDRLEPLLFALQRPIERLTARLAERGLACGRLTLKLDLSSGVTWRSVEPAAPTREPRALAAFVRYALEKEPAGAPVTGALLSAAPARPRFEQHRLFGLPTVPPEQLWTTLARLEALSGEARLGSPELIDGFWPGDEGSRLARFVPPPPPLERAPEAPANPPLAALRLFRPPRLAEVLIARGLPAAVSADGVRGHVVDCAGPWRVMSGWWSAARARDGYDVSLSDGGTYRLAFDRIAGRWQVEGEYD
ncbi:MAG: DNA polymerase Y family protein [Myxococcales bacterium]